MILTFSVSVDVPSISPFEIGQYIPYIKYMLSGRLGLVGNVKGVIYESWLTKFDNETAELLERDAYDHGELSL